MKTPQVGGRSSQRIWQRIFAATMIAMLSVNIVAGLPLDQLAVWTAIATAGYGCIRLAGKWARGE